MRAPLIRNLNDRFRSYAEMIAAVDDRALAERLDVPRHRTLTEHLWCIVSSRETYARSLAAGSTQAWQGASFAMDPAGFAERLDSSAAAAGAAIEGITDWTEARDEILIELCEHELMHEAQIIRHFLGAGLDMPKSLKWAVCD